MQILSPLKLQNIDSFEFKKILILNQNIKVYPSNLDKLFKFFSQKKNEKVILKNSQITFIDDQKNQLSFNNLNLKDNFDGKKHQIKGDVKFSGNKIYLEFLNITNEEKLLKINIPNLKQSLDINFTPKTTLDNYSGVLKLKLLETISLYQPLQRDLFKHEFLLSIYM